MPLFFSCIRFDNLACSSGWIIRRHVWTFYGETKVSFHLCHSNRLHSDTKSSFISPSDKFQYAISYRKNSVCLVRQFKYFSFLWYSLEYHSIFMVYGWRISVYWAYSPQTRNIYEDRRIVWEIKKENKKERKNWFYSNKIIFLVTITNFII